MYYIIIAIKMPLIQRQNTIISSKKVQQILKRSDRAKESNSSA
jgi:hypothetical protein